MSLPAEEFDVSLVVCDVGPLVDQRDGKIFSQMRRIARCEGGAVESRGQRSFIISFITFYLIRQITDQRSLEDPEKHQANMRRRCKLHKRLLSVRQQC